SCRTRGPPTWPVAPVTRYMRVPFELREVALAARGQGSQRAAVLQPPAGLGERQSPHPRDVAGGAVMAAGTAGDGGGEQAESAGATARGRFPVRLGWPAGSAARGSRCC